MTVHDRSIDHSSVLEGGGSGPDGGSIRTATVQAPGIVDRLARRAVLGRLEALEEGELTIRDGAETHRFGGPAPDGLEATITVRDPGFWSALAGGGSIGAGEAYAAGWWQADDLVATIRLIARNRRVNEDLDGGVTGLPGRLLQRLAHLGRGNTRAGSRRNVLAHYDLGNELFSLFLDSGMTYSSAIFPSAGVSLERAQREKLDRVCRTLGLGPDDDVIEIGTGWGSFALHAAGEYGCRVTTTTLSEAQYEVAAERVRTAGLDSRVTLLRTDYRDLPTLVEQRGRGFDKLVSIEMIEAVGEAWLDRYLEVIDELLEPHGSALIQAILMADRYYDDYRKTPDLIQRLIFPGTHLPALSDLLRRSARVTDLTLSRVDDITPHYAETLARWRERFVARWERVRALGYSEELCRLWELYFCYCEGGFREGVIRDAQLRFDGPRAEIGPAAGRRIA